MTGSDLGITMFFGIGGSVALAMGNTTTGVIFVVIAALMVGISWGSKNK